MVILAAWIVIAFAALGWAAYATAMTLPDGHHGGRRRLGCMRRHAAVRVTKAAYAAAIWAAGTARRARAERGRT